MSWTDSWKTHPTKFKSTNSVFFKFGHDLDWSLENSSNSELQNFWACHGLISGKLIQTRANSWKIIFDEFRAKMWTSFPKIRLCHIPENWNFWKISGWVFHDLLIRVKEITHNSRDSWDWIRSIFYRKT